MKRRRKFILNTNKTGRNKKYDKVYCSIDERLSEKVLLESSELIQLTHYVPQHFVYIECERGAIGELNYLFDYDLNHISNRFTDLKYSLKNTKKTIICAEVTATKNILNIDKKETDEIISRCCLELQEISKNFNKSDLSIFRHKLTTIPKTYRIPKIGYSKKLKEIKGEIFTRYGENLVLMPWLLTRKEMLDSVSELQVVS